MSLPRAELGQKAEGIKNPLLSHVVRSGTGKVLAVNKIFASITNHKALRFKQAIADARSKGSNPYICPGCGGGVFLSRSSQRAFFFKHIQDERACSFQLPPKERNEFLEDIEYNLTRESELHIVMKNEIANCLKLDQRFEDIKIQKRLTSRIDTSKYKIPDVSATVDEITVVFEAQINNTFFNVAQRLRSFYKNEGICLAWIMPSFDPYSAETVQEDVIIQQADTAFVLDQETIAISKESGTFTLKAYSFLPKRARWVKKLVSFEDIILDSTRGIIRVEPSLPINLRDELKDHILQICDNDSSVDWTEYNGLWFEICEAAMEFDIEIDMAGVSPGLRALIRAIQSATNGRPYGWNYDHLIQVAHHLSDYDWISMATFLKIVTHAGHEQSLRGHGDQEKWERKKSDIREFWPIKKQFYNKTNLNERRLARTIFPEYADLIVEPSF